MTLNNNTINTSTSPAGVQRCSAPKLGHNRAAGKGCYKYFFVVVQAFAANCICEIPYKITTKWVRVDTGFEPRAAG